MYTCPCCGHEVFVMPPGSYDICPVCFWEDDGHQLADPFAEGGSNGVSLAQAQVAFVQLGACEHRLIEHVRPALPDEKVDPLWFPLWAQRVDLPPPDDPPPDAQSPLAMCYWLRSRP